MPTTNAAKRFLELLLIASTGCLIAAAKPSPGGERAVPIELQAFGALSGPVQSFGINSRAALLAASRRIDANGGVRLADGSVGHFKISYADDHCKPDDGIALLRAAAASDAIAVIGPSCSSVAEPLYGVLQRNAHDTTDSGLRIPVFTDGATKANLARISEWAFRNSPNEGDMYEALWQWVRTQYPNLHTVYAGEESDFAHSHSTLQNIISKQAAAAGLQQLGSTGWSINDVSFAAPARSIQQANADIVVISAHARTTCGVLKQLSQYGVHPKLLVGLTSASTAETLQLCGPAAEGLLIPTTFVANSDETRREAAAVAAEGGSADLHSMAAWEILYTLKSAIEKSGIVPSHASVASDRERLRETLASLRSIDGVMGPITRTPDRESRKPFYLVRVSRGQWEVISSHMPARETPIAPMSEEHFLIPFGPHGLRLFVRHLPPVPVSAPAAPASDAKTVLFVHGATFPSALAAAFPFGGHSWMEDLADAHFDVWALDFMGYGGSDRYPEMKTDTGASGPPLLRTEEASRQIETAATFISTKGQAKQLSIIAHSWGTFPAALFAIRRPDLIDRLVLFGPPAMRHEAQDSASEEKPVPAWNVTIEVQRKRFYGYAPAGEPAVLSESDMRAWGPAYLASDPNSLARTPPSVRVPYGPLADVNLAWSGSSFPYDPAQIRSPTLIIRGEWDDVTKDDDARWLFTRLRNAPVRRDVVISRGTHVMHLEDSRFQLYREVQTFLEGRDSAPALSTVTQRLADAAPSGR